MIRPIAIFALASALIATSPAQQSPVPANVMVGTEEMKRKDFTVWTETDRSKYDGTFAGDAGGDSSGKLTIKTSKAKSDGSPASASGSYTLTAAGSTPTVVKFENAPDYGDPAGVFSAGAFSLVFVKYGKTPGVIVGNVFIPKS